MNRAASENPGALGHRPKPILKKMRWPYHAIWIVPVLAAILAGYYAYDHFASRGPSITVSFPDATGLKPSQSKLMRHGVEIGQVDDVQLAPDQKQTLVHVLLNRQNAAFAKKGAKFWIVSPQISVQQISGLATVLSGPYIEATPGDGEAQTDFTGLPTPPVTTDDGLRVILSIPRMGHMGANAPVYYRGIEVGVIEDTQLSSDATGIDVHIFIQRRFSPLVRANTQFWLLSGIDIQGGLLSGVQMKIESLRTLISGGVEFATPDKNVGPPAQDGSRFVLHENPDKDAQNWQPKIPIGPDQSAAGQTTPAGTGQAIKELTGGASDNAKGGNH